MKIDRHSVIIWSFFAFVFIVAGYFLLQRYPNPSLPTLLIALTLTFILDQLLKKHQLQKEKVQDPNGETEFIRKNGK
ncbi:hypothetical protein [Desulfitobacterium sp. AusDCA]|uniref:hypothetical protein n=1 Tax=Desulfitobacterium sp. AusDCA TaxID=3240383 RepID=UPI003DA6FCA6